VDNPARVAGAGPPPGDDRLFVRGGAFVDADYSGRRLSRLMLADATFTRCRFERLRVRDAALGVLGHPSEFVECSFDGSTLALPGSGTARFVGCTFRDVRLRRWTAQTVELVDCVFTGSLREVVFLGAPVSPDVAGRLGRERNEFRGNDFSGVTEFDVAFRRGIDLSAQRLPTGDDLVLLPDAPAALAATRAAAAGWPDPARRAAALALLDALAVDLAGGQHQLLVRPSSLRAHRPADVVDEVMDRLRAAV
jgi:hypothetical protein